MSWRVLWTRRSSKDLRKLDSPTQDRVLAALERLSETGTGDFKKLKDVSPPEWRLRVGDLRIRVDRDVGAKSIIVLRVLRRDKAY